MGVPAPPRFRPRARRDPSAQVSHSFTRILRTIRHRPGRSVGVAIAVAVGVALAIAIIAASNGIQTRINDLLVGNHSPQELQQSGIDINTIQAVLQDTRDLLTKLAIGFTAALVALVTWTTMGQRRREIGLDIQQGQYREVIMGELLGESLLLCIIGGIVGIIAGNALCTVVHKFIPNLPMTPQTSDILAIFPTTTILSFAATALVAAIFVAQRELRPDI